MTGLESEAKCTTCTTMCSAHKSTAGTCTLLKMYLGNDKFQTFFYNFCVPLKRRIKAGNARPCKNLMNMSASAYIHTGIKPTAGALNRAEK